MVRHGTFRCRIIHVALAMTVLLLWICGPLSAYTIAEAIMLCSYTALHLASDLYHEAQR